MLRQVGVASARCRPASGLPSGPRKSRRLGGERPQDVQRLLRLLRRTSGRRRTPASPGGSPVAGPPLAPSAPYLRRTRPPRSPPCRARRRPARSAGPASKFSGWPFSTNSLRRARRRAGLASVDGDDAMLARQVDHHEAAAAGTRRRTARSRRASPRPPPPRRRRCRRGAAPRSRPARRRGRPTPPRRRVPWRPAAARRDGQPVGDRSSRAAATAAGGGGRTGAGETALASQDCHAHAGRRMRRTAEPAAALHRGPPHRDDRAARDSTVLTAGRTPDPAPQSTWPLARTAAVSVGWAKDAAMATSTPEAQPGDAVGRHRGGAAARRLVRQPRDPAPGHRGAALPRQRALDHLRAELQGLAAAAVGARSLHAAVLPRRGSVVRGRPSSVRVVPAAGLQRLPPRRRDRRRQRPAAGQGPRRPAARRANPPGHATAGGCTRCGGPTCRTPPSCIHQGRTGDRARPARLVPWTVEGYGEPLSRPRSGIAAGDHPTHQPARAPGWLPASARPVDPARTAGMARLGPDIEPLPALRGGATVRGGGATLDARPVADVVPSRPREVPPTGSTPAATARRPDPTGPGSCPPPPVAGPPTTTWSPRRATPRRRHECAARSHGRSRPAPASAARRTGSSPDGAPGSASPDRAASRRTCRDARPG